MSRKKKKNKESRAPAQPVEPPVQPAEPPKRASRVSLFLIAVLIVAAVIRFINLGKAELWQDELGFLIYAHTGLSVGDVCRNSWGLILSIGQLPLSFLVFNISFRIMELVTETAGPFTPALVRFPAVVFGIVSIWTTYKLSLRILDMPAARLATIMMTVFFFPVYYAREAYVYSQIIMLTPLAVYAAIEIIYSRKTTMKAYMLLLLSLTAILYSHLGALMVVVGLALCILIVWISANKKKETEVSRPAFTAGVICAAALVLASPYILRFVLFNKAHTSGADYSHLVILNDVVAKLFMGEMLIGNIVSWLVLGAGIASLMLPHSYSRERKLMAWVTIIGLLGITWATERSQYLSARYFAPVAPLALIVMGQGLYQIGLWVAKVIRLPETRRVYAVIAVAAVPVCIHAFVFTPAQLNLSQKSTPFGAVARWVNEELDPGVPYLLESAYEYRWVGRSFPTPSNITATPYVHGNHPSEVDRLHAKQVEFMTRFPEAPFVESAHHNWNDERGLWKWPHENFRQHIIIGDPESTTRLIRMGIYPGLPHEELSKFSYRVDIYYNTWDDRVAIAREKGLPVLPDFAGWRVAGQQVSQQETMYFRVQQRTEGALRLVNVGDQAVSGTLRLSVAMPGNVERAVPLQFSRGKEILHRTQIPVGRSGDIEIPVENIEPGEFVIQWKRGDRAQDGLIVLNAEWQ